MPLIELEGFEEATKREVWPAGTYTLRVAKGEVRRTQAKDANLYVLYLEDDDHEQSGRVFAQFCDKEAALWKMREFIEAADIPHEVRDDGTWAFMFPEDFLGAVCKAEVIQSMITEGAHEGELRNEITKFHKA